MNTKRSTNVAVALLLLATAACAEGDAPDTAGSADTAPALEAPAPATQAPAAAGESVSVADIMDNPAAYDGREVTVEADVEEVLTARAFALDEDSPVEGGVDEELVVLYPMSASLADIDDQWLNNRVRVTGTVRTVDVVEIEREVGWDLDAEIETELEGRKPVLVAREVERTSGM